MKRNVWRFVFLVLGAVHLAAAIVVWRSPDPRYQLAKIVALGRYDEFDTEIRAAAEGEGCDPLVLKAIAWKATGFRANAASAEGKRGLLLIGENEGREWAAAHGIESFMFTDLFEAQTNLRAGSWLLARALKRWETRDDPLPFALAEFYAGREAIEERAGEYATAAGMMRVMEPATRDFVSDVIRRARMYRIGG